MHKILKNEKLYIQNCAPKDQISLQAWDILVWLY